MKSVDLTSGRIGTSLIKLAAPITLTGFVEMAYSLTDMFWISQDGADYVSAIGACSNFLWLATCFITIARVGGQIKVGHSVGAKDFDRAKLYIRSAFQLGISITLIFSIIFLFFPNILMSIFGFDSKNAINAGVSYLKIQSFAIPAQFSAIIFTGIFSALGNSKVSLLANSIGLIVNMILDPLLILGLKLGVIGAALATLTAQYIVFILFFIIAKRKQEYFKGTNILSGKDGTKIIEITKLGIAPAIQSSIFSIVSLYIGRMVAGYGTFAVGAQKVGAQLEAISWKTSDGLGTAMNAFSAQNYGANKLERAKRGYIVSLFILLFFGGLSTFLLLCFPSELMSIFFKEPNVIDIGANYLYIMGFSQIFMCLELVTNGALAGLGITFLPNILCTIIVSSRIILAPILSSVGFGITGIWLSITISSIVAGISSFIIYIYVWKKKFNKMV